MNYLHSIIILLITSFMTLVGNYIGIGTSPLEALPGMIILLLIVILGLGLSMIIPIKIPSVAYIVTIAAILTLPQVPYSEKIVFYTGKVNFLTLCTPILAYAGIYTGKNLENLKKIGGKIFVLALFVMLGTYLGSAVIAHIILKLLKQI